MYEAEWKSVTVMAPLFPWTSIRYCKKNRLQNFLQKFGEEEVGEKQLRCVFCVPYIL